VGTAVWGVVGIGAMDGVHWDAGTDWDGDAGWNRVRVGRGADGNGLLGGFGRRGERWVQQRPARRAGCTRECWSRRRRRPAGRPADDAGPVQVRPAARWGVGRSEHPGGPGPGAGPQSLYTCFLPPAQISSHIPSSLSLLWLCSRLPFPSTLIPFISSVRKRRNERPP
jgi:hypothetical protein